MFNWFKKKEAPKTNPNEVQLIFAKGDPVMYKEITDGLYMYNGAIFVKANGRSGKDLVTFESMQNYMSRVLECDVTSKEVSVTEVIPLTLKIQADNE